MSNTPRNQTETRSPNIGPPKSPQPAASVLGSGPEGTAREPDTVLNRFSRDESGLPRPSPSEPSAESSPRPDTVVRRVERDEFGLPRPVQPTADKRQRQAAADLQQAQPDELHLPRPKGGALKPPQPQIVQGTTQIEGQALARPEVHADDRGGLGQKEPHEHDLPAQIRATRSIPREPNLLPPRSPSLSGDVQTLIDPELREVTETFAGRFDILRQIGRGGMGSVFLAHQTGTQRQLAIKVLRGLRNKKDFIRFEREMNLMARISHPNVVKVFDYGQAANGATFLAMEYVEGQTLFELLYRQRLLPLQQTLRIAYHIALGLGAAHDKGIIHRDVKPENIMVSNHFGLPDFAQILDFGIAREAKSFNPGAAPLTSGGVFLGTPRYAAPEAIRGEVLTPRTDVYSFGCLLFQLLAERCPFEDPSPLTVMDQHLKNRPTPTMRAAKVAIPNELATLVDAMLSKRAQYRPESMAVVADTLSRLMEAPAGTPQLASSAPRRPEAMMGFDEDLPPQNASVGEPPQASRSNPAAKHERAVPVAKSSARESVQHHALIPVVIWGLAGLALAGWLLFLTST